MREAPCGKSLIGLDQAEREAGSFISPQVGLTTFGGDQDADAAIGRGSVVADNRQVLDAGIKNFTDDAVQRADRKKTAEQDVHPVFESGAQRRMRCALAGGA